ncbi:DNA-binding response regulator [Paenibacillus chartarius]|uniref:DNA-binding response regulator n=1 Tax=Paenibacillus chartarius TaxID=747481 RepID=A0ABV6DS12_9BACL
MEREYQQWLDLHRRARKGERLRRLEEGHNHAEQLLVRQVWWPAVQSFEHLHPEYEVVDFRNGSRFLDFAYVRPMFKLDIEVEGYGPHARDISRRQFSDQAMRHNHLTIDGWRIIRFTYDDITERPRLCQQLLQQMLWRWVGEGESLEEATFIEREVIRFAMRSKLPITPNEVCRHLGMEGKYVRKLLQGLVQKQWMRPARGLSRSLCKLI